VALRIAMRLAERLCVQVMPPAHMHAGNAEPHGSVWLQKLALVREGAVQAVLGSGLTPTPGTTAVVLPQAA
jgi:hypothetical protein